MLRREIIQAVQDQKISVTKAMELLGYEPYPADNPSEGRAVTGGEEMTTGKASFSSGDLVVVGHWADLDIADGLTLGVLVDIKDGYYYVDGDKRGYRHCIKVNRHAPSPPAQDGLMDTCRKMVKWLDDMAHELTKNSDGGQYAKGMTTAYWAARDELLERIGTIHPSPPAQDGLREALEKLRTERYQIANGGYGSLRAANIDAHETVAAIDEILSRHFVPTVEPLAELAERKGYYINFIIPPCKGYAEWKIHLLYDRAIMLKTIPVHDPTYAVCELKARQFLMALPDKEGR